MPDLLLEIGLEEVPARMIPAAQAELLKRTLALLTREHLIDAETAAHSYSTPRRLAVLVHGVKTQQADVTEETTGPAVKIAFKDGVPTPAAEAFARKSGVAVADLKTTMTPKGEYLAAATVKRGRPAAEVLAAELPKEIAAIYWAKNMYWRAGKPERFVRPVLWLACLLGDAVVPVSFAGKTAGRASFGHRVLSSGEAFEIVSPESYLAQLEGEYVLADVETRRHKIRKALDHGTRQVAGARWREDEALVDAVTHLTEWPDVLLGSFEPAYLALPEEVLVTVMRDHQKYFAVEDAAGKLAPHFLTVTNIALDDENTATIQQGNERVLRARFNDARFFWEFDQRVPLAERVKLLENVTFQKDLGSYAAKAERVRALAAKLTEIAVSRGAKLDAQAIDEAATLAKTDLTTELVKEFTELQGIIGGLYAASQGVRAIAADAIYDQYLPASASDAIPRSPEGAVLGIADRIDTVAGMFRLGLEPTGSKDPFALRRAANGIIKMLAESSVELPLVLSQLIQAAVPSEQLLQDKIARFLTERLDFYLRDYRGITIDVVRAVSKMSLDNVRDVVSRAQAVSKMRGSEDFLAVCASFKRMTNILKQLEDNDESLDEFRTLTIDTRTVNAEADLFLLASKAAERFGKFSQVGNYEEALREAAKLRPAIDRFFDEVMVSDPDPTVRARRVNLLRMIVTRFSQIADFSEIVAQG